MGACVSENNPKHSMKRRRSDIAPVVLLNPHEKHFLELIYQDLASRTSSRRLDHHTFGLFFELTGLWGSRLYKYFDVEGKDQLGCEDFLSGMSKIVRASFDERINILFNFIKNPLDSGIGYKQFLKMLYHYSKKQLKQILTNDGVFVHESIIPSSAELQKQKQSGIVRVKHRPGSQRTSIDNRTQFQTAFEHISKDYQDPGTLLQFKTDKLIYQVSYCNMSTLTHEYATHIFNKYGINQDTQTMEVQQFRLYIESNMKMFDTYYAAFHENLWGVKQGRASYLNFIERQSRIYLIQSQKRIECYLVLALHTLIICSDPTKQDLIRVIILSGIATSEGSSQTRILLRDEPNSKNQCQLQFSSVVQRQKWEQQLRIYSNNYLQNKYEIVESIGTGRFSVVYRCCLKADPSKQYALKILQLDQLSPKEIKTIQHESQVLKILKSPSFVKQYETITTKRTIYIVSEYVYGQDLFEYVRKKKRLAEEEAAFLLGQIIQAVMHLHSMEIIHRDLKPENIMVSYKRVERTQEQLSPVKLPRPRPETIKLIDFGFANYFSALQETHEDTPIGTLNYIAPEILLGGKPTYQNDTFSIGSIMYFMLRGKYAFDSQSPEGTAIMTVKGEYNLNDGVWAEISDEGVELVGCLLKADPNERITLKEALNHPWFKTVTNYRPDQA